MSFVQRIFSAILPRSWSRDMEASSRSWMVRCESCNFERSVWDWGGIRWGASGNPRRRLKCTQCGTTGWHRLHRI